MEVNKIIIVCILSLLFGLILFFTAELACYLTKGKVLGKVFHKLNKWHWPDEHGRITVYNSGQIMSYCKYCGKRITRVGLDWFAINDNKK